MPTGYTDFYRGLFITVEALLTSSPVDGQVDKAPTSDWAFDHAADENAHHTPGKAAISGGYPADSYDSILQGTWIYTGMSCGMFSAAHRNNPAINGDGLRWYGMIEVGTYEMCIAMSHWNDCGIVKFKIGTSNIKTIDSYSAANVFTVNRFQFQVTANPGFYAFDFYIDGKNASSSNYRMNLVYWSLCKSA